ncbi:MAG: ankyrin repeat domain-containing protein [Planctomycetota bacterium]
MYFENQPFLLALCDNLANVNARNNYGETPLCCAVIWGYKDMVEPLITNGADINVKAKGDRTTNISGASASAGCNCSLYCSRSAQYDFVRSKSLLLRPLR